VEEASSAIRTREHPMMSETIKEIIADLTLYPPATEESLKDVERKVGFRFPVEYREFMLMTDGAEGVLGTNSYLVIWHIGEVIELNEGYAVEEFTPGIFYFGSDGGGMAFAFDTREEQIPIVEFPVESINIEDVRLCGKTFNDFLQELSCRGN
jgi:hypothetical protein